MQALHRPFRPLGPLQLQHLGTWLENAHQVWHRRWFKDGLDHELKVQCEVATVPGGISAGDWLKCQTRCGAVFLALPDSLCGEFVESWIGTKPEPEWRDGDAASRLLAQRILGDWFGRVVGAELKVEVSPAAVVWNRAAPDEGSYAPASGAVCASFETWFGNFQAIFDGDYVQAVQPTVLPMPRNIPHRVPLLQAIRSAQVKLQASANASAQLSIGSLRNLSVGDVLLLEPTVTETWNLATTAGQHVADCHIGRKATNRAVLISSSKEFKDGR